MGHRLSLLITLALGLAACGAAPAATAPVAAAPTSLPSVTLATLDGEQVELARVARGRVALVSLWATWCEACEKEMDALNRLDAKTGADAVVIGVAIGEKRETVADFARHRGLRYVQLVDSDFAFADAIGQRRLPTTLVVDRQGHIVFRGEAIDGRSLDALRRAIRGTL
jgi:peroxiredoxin